MEGHVKILSKTKKKFIFFLKSNRKPMRWLRTKPDYPGSIWDPNGQKREWVSGLSSDIHGA